MIGQAAGTRVDLADGVTRRATFFVHNFNLMGLELVGGPSGEEDFAAELVGTPIDPEVLRTATVDEAVSSLAETATLPRPAQPSLPPSWPPRPPPARR